MACSYGKRYFYQTLNVETCEHAECASSTNSLYHLFHIKYEEDNNVDGEMHECCKKCVDKKYGTCEAMNLEEADSSDANNDNVEIANEGNLTIANEQRSFEGLEVPTLLHCND